MNNRIYYGEYSLKHWIDLILSNNIKLPDYQRHFVWKKRDVKRLIRSFLDKQFVQPVTIALYNVDEEKSNLIIDGQQRLTSILLAYLRVFPNRKAFESNADVSLASGDDSAMEENNTPAPGEDGPIFWKFTDLLSEKNTKESILKNIEKDDRYIRLNEGLFENLDDSFFENTFMGFSYIVPEANNREAIQKDFSRMFRNINYFGKKLDVLESRKSLYFQNGKLINFFDGKNSQGDDVLCNLRIMEKLQPLKIDFVRYLSILSQYLALDENESKIMVGYSAFSSRESFYADYVSYVLGQGKDEQESRSDKFDNFDFEVVFEHNCWVERFERLRLSIDRLIPLAGLNKKKAFASWIDSDYWLFGLIYYIVFKDMKLKDHLFRNGNKGNLKTLEQDINEVIKKKKDEDDYGKNPNRLSRVRERVKDSCNIYIHYVQ